ncbi:MAG: hypothetical protein COB33_008585 [Thiotrichaceae bacterium]|nr:hypothetical protein [Thiotrichaceae bacterium]PCI11840.1 MAG: hypothetical protein COB71_11120 [Thiotrichales bacterium]
MILKNLSVICLILSQAVVENICNASENSLGIGAGAPYTGIGINYGFINNADLKYISFGCMSIGSSSNNAIESNCGFGAGWMRSDIITTKNDNHGIGLHVSATYNTHDNRDDIELFYGVTYGYYFKGMDSQGWSIGFSPSIINDDKGSHSSLWVNLGYQYD